MERKIEKIIIHCSATKPTQDVGSKEIRSWHMAKGWKDIGYHFVVRRDGKIELGRKLDVRGAHARGHNSTSIGVCYIGGVDENNKPEDNRTEQQLDSLEFLVSLLWAMFPDADVMGHCDLPEVTKACPCFDVKNWLESFGDHTSS
jgi:N-acetyl-anhydromuramyl-L-alanine amidase AmpD